PTVLSLTIHTISIFFSPSYLPHPPLHSFPTRRSSDLIEIAVLQPHVFRHGGFVGNRERRRLRFVQDLQFLDDDLDLARQGTEDPDRKSTRLNSSHSQISYAVFCLKKKKTNTNSKLTRI